MSKSIKEIVLTQLSPNIKTYNKGIFFDNEDKYIERVRQALPNIDCIKVNETKYGDTWDWQNKISDANFIKEYIVKNNLVDNNLYKLLLKKLEQQQPEDKIKLPFYDPKLRCDIDSGLNGDSNKELDNWISTINDGEKCCALFDWDRTISQIEFLWTRGYKFNVDTKFVKEGYFLNKLLDEHPIDDTITDEEYLEFLCGGAIRLAFIRSMLDKCKLKNIDIIVLTNNINCSLITNECIVLFNALVGEIPGSSTSEIRILCASETTPDKFNKVKAIISKCNFIPRTRNRNNINASGGGKSKKNKVKSKKNKIKSKKNKVKSKKYKVKI